MESISQGGLAFFFPIVVFPLDYQVNKYPKYMQSITIHLPHHNSPPPPVSTGNPGRIGGGISQSKLESLKGRGSFSVPGQQLSKMHVEHDHSPTPPLPVGKLERIRRRFFPNVGKFLGFWKNSWVQV
jgi:hypothetical protein